MKTEKNHVSPMPTYPGADCRSKHQLLKADLRYIFKSNTKNKSIRNQLNLNTVEISIFEEDIQKKITENSNLTTINGNNK